MIKYIHYLREHIREDKKSFYFYSFLRMIVLLIFVRCIFLQNYESAAYCALALLLFFIPSFFEVSFHVDISSGLENCIYAFIFGAEILGEIANYYTVIPYWDTILHTVNGFLCAAIGYSLVEILNKKSQRVELSPIYTAIVAFCFSMTIGVLWEFFEFGCDHLLGMDTQKDFLVTGFQTTRFNETFTNIQKTVIY